MANPAFRYLLLVLAFSSFLTMANAVYLTVQSPVSVTLLNNNTLNLGKVGPGESFSIIASPQTNDTSGTLVSLGWNKLQAVSLPLGWSSQSSNLYENPLKLKIKVAAAAPNGTYVMTLRAVNVGNYSKLPNLTFTARINVTKNVFSASVNPQVLTAGPGQPANLQIVINNTGVSDDPFLINAYGLPAWNVPAQVIATHSSKNTFLYPIFENAPGVYSFNLTINSTTSPLLHQTYPIGFTVKSSLLNDFGATGQGVVLSPVIYEPVYSFMLLLSDLYHMIVK